MIFLKYKFLIILGFLQFFAFNFELFSMPVHDNLAADSVVLEYRTDFIDEYVLKVPENIKSGLNSEPELNLKFLVKYLTQDNPNEYKIVKRIHDWISENIAYDKDAVNGLSPRINEIPSIIKEKRAICGGFALLFSYMAKLANIETVIIKGITKVSGDTLNENSYAHVWNAVKIKSKWYIVDVTHDNRFDYMNGSFQTKKKYSSTQLFIAPKAKIIYNRPLDDKFQFIEKPVSKEKFLSEPNLSLNTLIYGVDFITDLSAIVIKEKKMKFTIDKIYCKNQLITIVVKAPPEVHLSVKLLDKDEKPVNENAFIFVDEGKYVCQFSAPDNGEYKAVINGCFWEKEKTTRLLYSFYIESKEGPGLKLPVSNILFKTHYFFYYGVKLLQNKLVVFYNEDSNFIELEHPDDVNIFIGIYEDGNENVLIKGTTTLLSTKNKKVVSQCAVPDFDRKEYIIKIKAKFKDDKNFSNLIALLKIEKK